jgi:hypothetical protein
VAMQGRVMAALDAAFTLPMAISLALGAGIVAVVGFRTIYVAEAIALLVVTGYLIAVSRGGEPAAAGADPIADDAPRAAQAAAGSIDES